jgi:hypothetical protein
MCYSVALIFEHWINQIYDNSNGRGKITRVKRCVRHTYGRDLDLQHTLKADAYSLTLKTLLHDFGITVPMTKLTSSHVISHAFHMVGLQFRCSVRCCMAEHVRLYGNALASLVVECPQTWLFLESARGILEKCTGDQCLYTNDLIAVSRLVPSLEEWRGLGDRLGFTLGSKLAHDHSWRWYRMKSMLSEYKIYADLHDKCYAMGAVA